MLLQPVDYYAIVDVNGEKENLKVVGEYDNRPEAEVARDKLEVRGCEVYAEVGGKLYRVVCEQVKMISHPHQRNGNVDYVR